MFVVYSERLDRFTTWKAGVGGPKANSMEWDSTFLLFQLRRFFGSHIQNGNSNKFYNWSHYYETNCVLGFCASCWINAGTISNSLWNIYISWADDLCASRAQCIHKEHPFANATEPRDIPFSQWPESSYLACVQWYSMIPMRRQKWCAHTVNSSEK